MSTPLPTLPQRGRTEAFSLLAVQPHPDDESIGMGGTLARYSAEGMRTTLVTATRGEVGEILDKDLDPKEAAPRLASIREAELRNAVKIMGVTELVFLGYEDSGMAGLPRNREPATFWQADEEEAIGRLIQVVRRVRPQVMVTQNEFGGYGHPDHIKTHRVAIGAFYYAGDLERFPGGEPFRPSKLYYSAFPKSLLKQMAEAMERAGVENRFSSDGEPPPFAVSDDRVTTWLDISPFLDKKLAAMRAHRTQIPEDSWFMKLSEVLGPQAWRMETFERVRSSVDAPVPETDLFAGLR
jgi:N-acetyl-1-D-myo-inositol-2-amino-2-deoxy-alpha-D-glucopyranoside deacetylase